MNEQISLKKGQQVSLTKGVKKLRVEVSWTNSNSFGKDMDFDIDLIAVECENYNDKPRCIGPSYLVFYGSYERTDDNKISDRTGAVVYSGDDRGDEGDTGGEEMVVYPNKIDPRVNNIIFLINIYEGIEKGQTFKLIKGTEVKVFEDSKLIPTLVYQLNEDIEFREGTLMILGSLNRSDVGRDVFNFKAIGESSKKSLGEILRSYYLDVKD